MKTALKESNVITRWACPLCGGSTWKTNYTVALIDDSGDKVADCVCEGCMKDGPEGAALRMRVEAERLRERADRLDAMAPEVAAIAPDDWTTVERAEDFSREVDRQCMEYEAEADALFERRRNADLRAAADARENTAGLPVYDERGELTGFVKDGDMPF